MSYIGENLDDQFNIFKLHKNRGWGIKQFIDFFNWHKEKKKADNESSRVLISFYHFKFKLQ